IDKHGNMSDARRGRRGHQFHEGKLVHEIVQEFAILHQMRLWDIERTRLLRLHARRGGRGESRQYHSAVDLLHAAKYIPVHLSKQAAVHAAMPPLTGNASAPSVSRPKMLCREGRV